MRKNFSVALLCAVAATASGQRTVSVSATVTPTLIRTDYNQTYLYPDSDGQVVEPVLLRGTVNAVGYSAGLTAHYAYAPGWWVAAGIWYDRATLRQVRPAAAGAATTAVRSRAVRFPLLLSYQPSTRRLSPYFSLGLLLDFPFAARVVVTRDGQPTQRLRLGTDGGPVFKPLLAAGGRYRINRRMALTVQPTWANNLGRFGGARTYNSSYEVGVLTQVMYAF